MKSQGMASPIWKPPKPERTHWLCGLFGHNYKTRVMRIDGLWRVVSVCPRCGDRLED